MDWWAQFHPRCELTCNCFFLCWWVVPASSVNFFWCAEKTLRWSNCSTATALSYEQFLSLELTPEIFQHPKERLVFNRSIFSRHVGFWEGTVFGSTSWLNWFDIRIERIHHQHLRRIYIWSCRGDLLRKIQVGIRQLRKKNDLCETHQLL